MPYPFKPGDKSKAVCPHCRKIVTTTIERKTVTNGAIRFEKILVALCDDCHHVVSFPNQFSIIPIANN